MNETLDVVVMGSGAAGLTAALSAANRGAQVLVLEKSSLIGGTTAISGGQLWIPNNRFVAPGEDSMAAAAEYLATVTLGEVEGQLIDAFLRTAPEMIASVEQSSPLRFFKVERADYHSEWAGAAHGRSIEPLPLSLAPLGGAASLVRRSPYRLPLTSAEAKSGKGAELIDERTRSGLVCQGVALVGGLLQGCLSQGVKVECGSAVKSFARPDADTLELRVDGQGATRYVRARSLVIASGGFEWNEALKHAFLGCVDDGAASPPANEGDGLCMGLAAGAAVANMTQAWWSAAFTVPGESYDGRPLVRNIVRELALPGSILVNQDGRRFANEAASYNALGKAFQRFDPNRNKYVNKQAWLIFDRSFKCRYSVATVPPASEAPHWFLHAESLTELANCAGIASTGLVATVDRFNQMADAGHDSDFCRGEARHDRYHGDTTQPHPNLGPIRQAPFYAVPIFLGNLGTKGGLKTSPDGRVSGMDGQTLPGLYACGNAAASWMGPGYPGAGGSLGPIMTAAYLAGAAATPHRTSSAFTGRSHGNQQRL